VADTDILAVKSGLRKALEAQDVDKIVEQFKIIYSSVPYVHFDSTTAALLRSCINTSMCQTKAEHFYSAVLLMYLQASGFDASPERLSNKGRLDLSLAHQYQDQDKDQQQIYIFELKTATPQKAIEQIIEKNYAGAYGNYQVTLVGLQIDFAERNIVSHQSTPGLELK
jgi:hypothetical protein